MQQLQYDSFYKFLVSAGIIVLVAPVMVLYFFISGKGDLLISQDELNMLSSESAELLSMKIKALEWVYSNAQSLCIVCVIVGASLIAIGCWKWGSIQKTQDDLIKLQKEELDIKVQQMTAKEVVKKAAREVDEIEEHEISSSDNSNTDKPTEFEKGKLATDKILWQIDINDLCCKKVESEKGSTYIVEQNVKVNQYEYDIIAYSKKNNRDFLYEIKAWDKIPSRNTISLAIQQTERGNQNYSSFKTRQAESMLWIVTKPDFVDEMKRLVDEVSLKQQQSIKIQVTSEKDLL